MLLMMMMLLLLFMLTLFGIFVCSFIYCFSCLLLGGWCDQDDAGIAIKLCSGACIRIFVIFVVLYIRIFIRTQ